MLFNSFRGKNNVYFIGNISLYEKLKQSHKIRIEQLNKNGWYKQLNIPFKVGYPMVQNSLF